MFAQDRPHVHVLIHLHTPLFWLCHVLIFRACTHKLAKYATLCVTFAHLKHFETDLTSFDTVFYQLPSNMIYVTIFIYKILCIVIFVHYIFLFLLCTQYHAASTNQH